MRLATTAALGHDGKDYPLFGLSVPIDVQRKGIQLLRQSKTHPTYALVVYQETDSMEPAWRMRFLPEPPAAQDLKKKTK